VWLINLDGRRQLPSQPQHALWPASRARSDGLLLHLLEAEWWPHCAASQNSGPGLHWTAGAHLLGSKQKALVLAVLVVHLPGARGRGRGRGGEGSVCPAAHSSPAVRCRMCTAGCTRGHAGLLRGRRTPPGDRSGHPPTPCASGPHPALLPRSPCAASSPRPARRPRCPRSTRSRQPTTPGWGCPPGRRAQSSAPHRPWACARVARAVGCAGCRVNGERMVSGMPSFPLWEPERLRHAWPRPAAACHGSLSG